ncbi:small multidrug efflux protein [Conyzicola sp.]|uniref:small multidrug efflux protein n=1 Tax=Conyzicola sp. TaxID=1969404 RepID=UPI003989ABAD
MDIVANFQDLVAQVPELVQPVIVALAGAVPFIEGEGATTIGILGGLNPVVAVAAAAIGNFLCVLVLVLLTSGARSAIVNRRTADEVVLATGGTRSASAPDETIRAMDEDYAMSGRKAARMAKFQRALDRYGVPGVSLLGPLLLPTQFTSTMLAAGGFGKARVLFWQAIAILVWSTVFGVVISRVVQGAN